VAIKKEKKREGAVLKRLYIEINYGDTSPPSREGIQRVHDKPSAASGLEFVGGKKKMQNEDRTARPRGGFPRGHQRGKILVVGEKTIAYQRMGRL